MVSANLSNNYMLFKTYISELVLGYEPKANFQLGGSVHKCEILNC